MKRVLLSWIGFADFVRNTNDVSEKSPNLNFHELNNKRYDIHILLTTGNKKQENQDWRKAMLLRSALTKQFRNIDFQLRSCPIDAFNLSEVYKETEVVISQYLNDEIDIIFSIGTSIMSVAWYMLHSEKGINSTLIQGIEPKGIKKTKAQFIKVDIQKQDPGFITIKQNTLESSKYKITKSIASIYEDAKIIAKYDGITTLISGDSGSGKEHLAKSIHQFSIRSNHKFVAINCSSLSDELLESRLFGHMKGSFSGAINETKGFFEYANGGTIFLDEIGDISQQMQQSLLRVIQEGKIIKVGGNKEIVVDVRVIAATNKNLLKEVKKGTFRQDLYYRLNETELHLPTLSSRGTKEIRELINYFIEKNETDFNKKLDFGHEAMNLLINYSYPGNVRQLQAIIKNIFIFSATEANKKRITKLLHQDTATSNNLKEVQHQHAIKILKERNGNKRQTAIALGITENTLGKYLDTNYTKSLNTPETEQTQK